jgi:hypothetical protein
MGLSWRNLEFLTVEEVCSVCGMPWLEIEPELAISSHED